MSADAPVIELIGADIPLAQSPGAIPILENVNWRVARGEFWAVGGFAGTGKTDLLSTAAGLQPPLRGSRLLFGRDTAHMAEQELVLTRLRVGMIFSAGRLFTDLTAAENVALPLRYHSEGNKDEIALKVSSALERTGLSEHARKLPRHIPRSLHQRVALARALALGAEVLLIDTPLLGADPRQIRWWLDFLCELNSGEHPTTVVIATDDFRPWIDTARQFAIVKSKRFELEGGREQVKAADDPVVRELLLES